MRQLLLVLLLGSALMVSTEGNVDAILEILRDLVRQMVPNPDMQQQFLAKIDGARGCLEVAKGINPDVVKKLMDGIMPTAATCAVQTAGISDIAQRKSLMKACVHEKADSFETSSGMTDAELVKFDMARSMNRTR
ncbi:uncharacterized protein LOC120836264 [Ixodes scapularis]|uniref:uncharacterized protein LOC120836264 n=1 Tax=Ixodes scapularis TaxID=6945 RepID=UPI001A9DCCAA|nr:uncharacterized protein LOC120836264 [Ixodes scapularis]